MQHLNIDFPELLIEISPSFAMRNHSCQTLSLYEMTVVYRRWTDAV